MIGFNASQFCTTQTTSTPDFDSLRPQIHSDLKRFLHRAPKANAPLQLECNIFGHELCIQVRLLDLLDIDIDVLAGNLGELLLQLVDLRAFAADHNTGSRGKDCDSASVGSAFDVDTRNRGALKFALKDRTDQLVFNEKPTEVSLVGEPFGAPVVVDRNPETDWICFLAHRISCR